MDKNNNEELWNLLKEKSRNIEMRLDSLTRKRTGAYYTDLILTDIMMKELVQNLLISNPSKKICNYRFLEPCVGSGNFVFSYIKAVYETNISRNDAFVLLDNIYVADINKDALSGYEESLKKIALLLWNIELMDDYFLHHIGLSGLLIDVTSNEIEYININNVFSSKIVRDGFDIIATNPPYKNLKAERSHYNNNDDYIKDKVKYNAISKMVKNKFLYSTEGVLNLYKLFVEEIIDNYANTSAFISLLIPSSITSDKTSQKLRTHMLEDNKMISIKIIEEGSTFIDAQQALCAILLKKGESTDTIDIVKEFCSDPNDVAKVAIHDILNENTGNSIVAISGKEYPYLRKLRQFPVVKDFPFIVNLRGELDLTANKQSIVKNNTGYPLLRGRNIDYYNLISSEASEYVTHDFVNASSKKKYIENERIACQQIANMNKERRITFALVPNDQVLGNSCNFISVSENEYDLDIYALLGLFNTKIINWLFKLTSSNNHVNNYEIDCFPIPIKAKELKEISFLVRLYLSNNDSKILDRIEELAAQAYGLNKLESEEFFDDNIYIRSFTNAIRCIIPQITDNEARDIFNGERNIEYYYEGLNKFYINVINGILCKYTSLSQGYILNHTTFKLSDLDLEMIKSVPPGGSWKDIPMETVEKSKRLKKITQTGGRTTLYGRIDYNKPSYTITTYFNRPGNGTYVHPTHERVLSVREAARFQAFKDDYYFFGNKTQLLKQVGNAVPTLLAYQIANEIKKKTSCSKSIDLFCGAGGMTAGFKAAGIHSLLSNDIEESACITLKINNPEINVLCGDITKTEIKDEIEKIAVEKGADIICGGPPCQGFSMAGFRSNDDPRNQLFREFVDIVKRVNPKVIVFENVEGLLSYQGGKTYREVHELFAELGYNTEGRTLMASDYGVPQKRKRVIIICTRNDMFINPSDLFPMPITIDESSKVTARDTISDLDTILCNDYAKYVDCNESDILKFFKGKISYEEYINLKNIEQHNNVKDKQNYEQLSLMI